MKYIENNYYELISHGNNFIIRFVEEIDYKYKFQTINQNMKEVYGYKKDEFEPLKVSISLIQLLVAEDSKMNSLLINDLNIVFSNFNETLNLGIDQNTTKYTLTYKNSSEIKIEVMNDDVNDFFYKVEILLGIKLLKDQKDQFLIKQIGY